MLNRYLQGIEFAYPQLLFFLLLLPLLAVWQLRKGRFQTATLQVSSLQRFAQPPSWKKQLRHAGLFFRLLSLAALLLALGRPRQHHDEQRKTGEGIDIVLCLDVSGSMLAQDFNPNRLEAAKEVAGQFVEGRPTDRFGLVVFAGESFTQCPVTTSREALKEQLYNVRSGFLVDGTAIGSGLASGVDRLSTSQAKSKVIILLTDGENNGGLIDPRTAKDMARTLGIRVYAIGVGSEGYAATPVQAPGGGIILQQERVNIDEELLTEIADETGGKYFRARDNKGLSVIYKEIDRMEKSTVEIVETRMTTERFHLFVGAALFFIFLEMYWRLWLFRRFP